MAAGTVASLRQAAAALGGEVSGQQVLCPGPGHSPRDRSLSVRFVPHVAEGFVTTSFSGDDWKACRDHVRERLGLPGWEPGDEGNRTVPQNKIDVWDLLNAAPCSRDDGAAERIARALHVWDGGCDPRGTVIERYLSSRGLDLPDDLAGEVLRFHHACPWRNESTGQTDRIPALLAAFRAIDGDAVTGVHRIRLDQHDRWPKAERRMLGQVQGAAVKLNPANGKLAVGEGIETCLAARRLGFSPVWALGSAGAISAFPLLTIQEIVFLGEPDEANRKAASMCAERYRRAGIKARLAMPNIGKDFNDVLMGRA